LKILSFHIILLLFIAEAFGQSPDGNIELYIGPELNMANNIQVPQIFGHDEKAYYAYSFDYREAVEKLDTKFRSLRRKHLDLLSGMRSRTLLALFHFHDSIYMFTSEQRIKRMLLYVETIDKETLLQNGDERLIMNIENMSGWGSEFAFSLSREQNKLLVISKLDVLSKNIQNLHFMMLGEGLAVEWEAGQQIIYTERPPRQSLIKVNEKGDVFIISLLDDQRLSSLWNEIKNSYHLVAVTGKGQYNNSYMLNLPELYIRGVNIEPGAEHDLSCAGLYSPSHARGMIDGMFYFELDNTGGKFLNQRLYEFEPYFLSEAIAGTPRKEPEEMYSFMVRHLIRRNNGDLIFLAENEFEQNYDSYQNIIAASFSPGGNLNWKRVILKRQDVDPSTRFNYSSFSVHAPVHTDKLYLVFNDDNKNGLWPPDDGIKTFHPNEKANLKIVGIGSSGELSSDILYRKTRRRMKTPIPLQYYDMMNMEMVIPSLRYKRYNYFRIGFSE
jgi:hypothetical protein